jgi:S1-C subfamily serine protease
MGASIATPGRQDFEGPAMRYTLSLCAAIILLFACGLLLPAHPARAQVDYATVGWWSIKYVEDNNGDACTATVGPFDVDKILIRFGLIRISSDIKWAVSISNPAWTSALRNKTRADWFFITDTKSWRTGFDVSEDKSLLTLYDVTTEFINDVAATRRLNILDENRRAMIKLPLNMKDSREALNTLIQCLKDHSAPPPPPNPPSERENPPSRREAPKPARISGTGFFVAPNQLVTNNHVVKECTGPVHVRYPNRPPHTATISGQDERNDLALLSTEMSNQAVASFRTSLRLGEPVAAFGFPYSDILPAEGNFTLGNITSLSGLGNDSNFLQVSTPIQPGNSGGPLLDMSGNVAGVVTSKLNALNIMKTRGDVPELVNFAIQGSLVVNFLTIKGVTPTIHTAIVSAFDTSGSPRNLSPPDVADMAKKFTVQIYCESTEHN